ncbi:hypothetical protein Taro_006957 [Colocasia esculenta]|uniref:Plantacyanin n=1 Tax=Colocasia esculenta TaxID=4460 RepID=A0A843TXP0_COLES|nr:hypothetical protein [Colocasia esculenta]
MASQGRGSARAAAVLLLCLIAIQSEAAVYTVGDSAGWTFNMVAWPRGKRFRAGDQIVFRYDPAIHNVVPVTAAGYNSCLQPRGAKVFRSGNDRITLARGTNYFICTVVGHCQAGMKVAILAA